MSIFSWPFPSRAALLVNHLADEMNRWELGCDSFRIFNNVFWRVERVAGTIPELTPGNKQNSRMAAVRLWARGCGSGGGRWRMRRRREMWQTLNVRHKYALTVSALCLQIGASSDDEGKLNLQLLIQRHDIWNICGSILFRVEFQASATSSLSQFHPPKSNATICGSLYWCLLNTRLQRFKADLQSDMILD